MIRQFKEDNDLFLSNIYKLKLVQIVNTTKIN